MKRSREGNGIEVDRYIEEISPFYGDYRDFCGSAWLLAVLILYAKASGRVSGALLQPYGQPSSWPLSEDASAGVAGWGLCGL